MTMKILSVENICSRVTSGGTPSRKQPDYYSTDEAGHLWIKSKELLDSSISDSEEKISDLGLKKSSAKYVDEGSVLIAMYGANVGQLGWLKKPATVNQAICSLSVDKAVANNRWLFYKLLNDRHRLIAMAQGAAQQNISQAKIKSFEIEVPPIDVQNRIAAILSAYDDLIENNTRRIEILEEMARRLYEEWFVYFRFPGHEEVSFKGSELGSIPEGWRVAQLSDICESLEDGDWVEKKDQGGQDYRLLQVSNIGKGSFVETGNFRFITEETYNNLKCREVNPGELLIARMPKPTGRAWLVEKMPWRIITSVDVAIAKHDNEKTTRHFLLHHLNSQEQLDTVHANQTGTTRPRISRRVLASLKLRLPDLNLQKDFSDIVQPFWYEISLLRKKNINLRAQRDLLLPKLVSGEIDVSDMPMPEDKEVEAA